MGTSEIVLLLGEESVLLTTGESVTNFDHVCLNNQSHYSSDVTEFLSDLCDTINVYG